MQDAPTTAVPSPGLALAPRPRVTDRLFFAVRPDAPTAARIGQLAASLRRDLGLDGRPLALPKLHVTVHFLGSFAGLPPARVDEARTTGAALRASPFEVMFDRVGSFAGRARNRPLVLRGGAGLQALVALHRRLGSAIEAAGLGAARHQPFVPHLTLLYDDRAVPERPIDPVTWTVRELVLVHSLVGRNLHQPLACWPLDG